MEHLNRVGTVLELIGIIIMSSSFAGEDRLHRWEASLKDYLDFRLRISIITEKIKKNSYKVFDLSRKVLYILVGTLIFASCLVINWTMDAGNLHFYQSNILPHFHKSLKDLIIYGCLYFLVGLIFLIIGYCLFFILVYLIDSIRDFRVTRFIVASGASILATIFYSLSLIVVFFLYFGSYVLLTPYLIAERVSVRFQLRPVFGVFGTIVSFVGVMFQIQ
jgi:hypothetical protein